MGFEHAFCSMKVELFARHAVVGRPRALGVLAEVVHPAVVAEVERALEQLLEPRDGVGVREVDRGERLRLPRDEERLPRCAALVEEEPAVVAAALVVGARGLDGRGHVRVVVGHHLEARVVELRRPRGELLLVPGLREVREEVHRVVDAGGRHVPLAEQPPLVHAVDLLAGADASTRAPHPRRRDQGATGVGGVEVEGLRRRRHVDDDVERTAVHGRAPVSRGLAAEVELGAKGRVEVQRVPGAREEEGHREVGHRRAVRERAALRPLGVLAAAEPALLGPRVERLPAVAERREALAEAEERLIFDERERERRLLCGSRRRRVQRERQPHALPVDGHRHPAARHAVAAREREHGVRVIGLDERGRPRQEPLVHALHVAVPPRQEL
jgi:hypothetical protein